MTEAARKMGPATGHLRSGRSTPHDWGRVRHPALYVLLLMLATILMTQPARAEKESTVLPQSGILYPGGFDPNTVGEIQGQVHGLIRPETGPVRFQVVSGRESYIVLASPSWYWLDEGSELAEGVEVIVHGSKSLGKDNKLYIIAQEIKIVTSGKIIVFRKEDGTPLWSSQAGKRQGYRSGFGSPMRGGSIKRGQGGSGPGRR